MAEKEKPTILVVDDEPDLISSLKDLLESMGEYKVITAFDGKEGFDIHNTSLIDLILIDNSMPVMTGMELACKIRNSNKLIPIILITGYGTIDVFLESMRIGINCFLSKPAFPEEILSTINELLIQNVPRESFHKCLIHQHSIPWMQNALSQKQTVSQKQNEYKQFCHTVIHSLRGEFMNLGNAFRNLRSDYSNHISPSEEDFNYIEECFQYCQLLSRRLIEYVDLGRPAIQDIKIDDFLEKIKSLLSSRISSNVKFSIEKSPQLNIAEISTDTEQIVMSLMELVQNANRALAPNGGFINIQVQSQNQESISITVSDNGPGLLEKVKENLFRQKVESKSGTGYGLYLSHKVISSLGGELSLVDSSEKGTTFKIVLPVKPKKLESGE